MPPRNRPVKKWKDRLEPGDVIYDTMLRSGRARREIKRILDEEEWSAQSGGFPERVTLDKLLTEPDVDPVYRIEHVFPLGEHGVCTAQRKTGKTTLRDNLIRSLVDGDEFLGIYETKPVNGVIALIDTEMSRRMSRRWLADQGIQNADKVDVWLLRGQVSKFDILTPQGRERWADELYANEVCFAILDGVADVIDAFGLSEDKDMGRFLAAWKETMGLAGITESMLFHHMGHSAERARGSSRILDYGFGEWRLVRKGQSENGDPRSERFFSAYGRDVDVSEGKLEYDKATRRMTMVGGSRRGDSLRGFEREVREFVKSNPGCSSNAIRSGVDGDNTLIDKARGILRKDEVICVHEKGQTHRHYLYAECPDQSAHGTAKLSVPPSAVKGDDGPARSQRGKKRVRRGKTS